MAQLDHLLEAHRGLLSYGLVRMVDVIEGLPPKEPMQADHLQSVCPYRLTDPTGVTSILRAGEVGPGRDLHTAVSQTGQKSDHAFDLPVFEELVTEGVFHIRVSSFKTGKTLRNYVIHPGIAACQLSCLKNSPSLERVSCRCDRSIPLGLCFSLIATAAAVPAA